PLSRFIAYTLSPYLYPCPLFLSNRDFFGVRRLDTTFPTKVPSQLSNIPTCKPANTLLLYSPHDTSRNQIRTSIPTHPRTAPRSGRICQHLRPPPFLSRRFQASSLL